MNKALELINDIRTTPKKYMTLLGSMCMMASLGSAHTLGPLSPYFISYLREVMNQKEVRYSMTIYIFTVQHVFSALFACISGILKNQLNLNVKIVSIVGSVTLR